MVKIICVRAVVKEVGPPGPDAGAPVEITIGSDVVINKRSKEHATATLSFNDILRKFIIEGLNINPSDLAKVLRKSRFTLEIEN